MTRTDLQNFVDTKMYQIRKNAFDYGLQLRIEDPHYVELQKEFAENSFLMSSQELNDAILDDFQENKSTTWDKVISNIDELDDVAKGAFAPNIGATKEVVDTVLKGEDLDNTEVLNKATTGRKKYSFKKTNPEFFKRIYSDIEKFEAKNKSTDDKYTAFGALTGAVAGYYSIVAGVAGHAAATTAAGTAAASAAIIGGAAALVGGTAVGTHHLSRDWADSLANDRIAQNQIKIEESKQQILDVQQNRPSIKARQYMQMGLTR